MHFRKYDPLICFALGQAGEVIRALVSGLHKKNSITWSECTWSSYDDKKDDY